MTTLQSNKKLELAQSLKEAFNLISPYIEKHTALVCPDCKNVCCIDKHCHYDEDDIVFISSLGADTGEKPRDRDEKEPCRFLDERGCSLERWERPYRCTFFFCDPLLKSLEDDNPKLYRAFMDYFHHLINTRQELLDQGC